MTKNWTSAERNAARGRPVIEREMKKSLQITPTLDNVQIGHLIGKAQELDVSEQDVIRRLIDESMAEDDVERWRTDRTVSKKFPMRINELQARHVVKLSQISGLSQGDVIRRLIDEAIAKNKDTAS